MLERRLVPSVAAVMLVVFLSSALGGVASSPWNPACRLCPAAAAVPRKHDSADLRFCGVHRGTAIASVQKIAKDVAGEMATRRTRPISRSSSRGRGAALRPIAVLLDEEPETRPGDLYYRRLIARDEDEACGVAHAYLDSHSQDELISDLLFPAVRSARRDREGDVLADDDTHVVYEATVRIATAEAPPAAPPGARNGSEAPRTRLLACPARDEADENGLRLLGLMLGATHAEMLVASHHLLVSEILTLVESEEPGVVCIGALPPGSSHPCVISTSAAILRTVLGADRQGGGVEQPKGVADILEVDGSSLLARADPRRGLPGQAPEQA